MRTIVAIFLLITASLEAQTASQPTVIVVDAAAPARPFPLEVRRGDRQGAEQQLQQWGCRALSSLFG
jgi:hypothetical protein